MKKFKKTMALVMISAIAMGIVGCGKEELSNQSLATYAEGYNFDTKDVSWKKYQTALAEGTTEYAKIIKYANGKPEFKVASDFNTKFADNGTLVAFNKNLKFGVDFDNEAVEELSYKAQYMFNAEYDSTFTAEVPAWSVKQNIVALKADNTWWKDTSVAYNKTSHIVFAKETSKDDYTLYAYVYGVMAINGTSTDAFISEKKPTWTTVGKTETNVFTTALIFVYDKEKGWITVSKVGIGPFDYKTQYPTYTNSGKVFKNF